MMYVDNGSPHGSPHRRGSLLPVRLPEPVYLEALHGAYKSDASVQFVSICISTPYTDEWGSLLPHENLLSRISRK
jgi:hypothetical protein